MLAELAVTNLGVIERAELTVNSGMTAVTGETGAGKTMIVQALGLLCGARAEASMVRTGASDATVEGRLVLAASAVAGLLEPSAAQSAEQAADADEGFVEVVVRRVVAAAGPSRAFINGRMATATELAELGRRWCDLHGQHSHQSLLSAVHQRDALDTYGAVDLSDLTAARAEVTRLEREVAELGGDSRERAHQIDLLAYQVREIDEAQITSPDELDEIAATEEMLADAVNLIASGQGARDKLVGEGGALDTVGSAAAQLADRPAFADIVGRLRSVAGELDDLTTTLRDVIESIDDDPAALDAVSQRRARLVELTRKYGDTLADVCSYRDDAAARLERFTKHDELAAELETKLEAAHDNVAQAARAVAAARKKTAPRLATEVTEHLKPLALPRASLEVRVGGEEPCDDVEMCFAASGATKPGPLKKVASGGELARVMLALRMALTAGPPTLVFDEVDAGIGGEAAVAVGRSLAKLAPEHQVFVVTHLPQVAAFASNQVAVRKSDDNLTVASDVTTLSEADRVTELTRMLAGRPDSESGRTHAAELLAAAAVDRS